MWTSRSRTPLDHVRGHLRDHVVDANFPARRACEVEQVHRAIDPRADRPHAELGASRREDDRRSLPGVCRQREGEPCRARDLIGGSRSVAGDGGRERPVGEDFEPRTVEICHLARVSVVGEATRKTDRRFGFDEKATVVLVATERNLSTSIPRGENAGVTVKHGPIVRELRNLGPYSKASAFYLDMCSRLQDAPACDAAKRLGATIPPTVKPRARPKPAPKP